MKITLVYPRLNEEDCGSGSIHMPLGVLYLASYLRAHGHECSLVDATFIETWEEFEERLKADRGDIIGMSFSSPLANFGFKAAEIAKRLYPESLIVTGGPHSTVDPEGTIGTDSVDLAVIGEGERILLEIVEALEGGKGFGHIKGIYYKEDGKVVKTEDRIDFETDLDSFPKPALDLIDLNRYIEKTRRVTIVTSRGCPGKCDYCQPTIDVMFGRKVRGHSPERIIEEVKYVAENYFHDNNFIIEFVDDTFCYNRKRVLDFCDLMVDEGLDYLPWWAISRVDHCKREEVVEALKKGGCVGISFGVESGSQRILDEMGKHTPLSTIHTAFEHCHKHGLLTVAFLMVGYPTEKVEDLLMTKKLVTRIHPDVVAVSITTPMLGTDLYEYAREAGILNISGFSDYGYYGTKATLKMDHLTNEQVVAFRKSLVKVGFLNLYKNMLKYIFIMTSGHRGRTRLFMSTVARSIKARVSWLNF